MTEIPVGFRECTYACEKSEKNVMNPTIFHGVSIKLSAENHKSKNQCDNYYRCVAFFNAPPTANTKQRNFVASYTQLCMLMPIEIQFGF